MLSGASSCKQRALSTLLQCREGFALWLWPSGCGFFFLLHQRLGIFFFCPAFISSPLSACDVSPLLTIRRVMGVPCTFPPSSCITQVFWRDFQSPGAFSPPEDDACKEGKGCCHHLPGSRICLLGPKTKASCCGQKCCFKKETHHTRAGVLKLTRILG